MIGTSKKNAIIIEKNAKPIALFNDSGERKLTSAGKENMFLTIKENTEK